MPTAARTRARPPKIARSPAPILAGGDVLARPRDADDLAIVGVAVKLEPAADRIGSRPEAARHRLVDDDGGDRSVAIGVGEAPSLQDRYPERPEIAGGDAVGQDEDAVPVGEALLPLGVDAAHETAVEGRVRSERRGGDAGDRGDLLEGAALELLPALPAVPLGVHVEREDAEARRVEAEVDRLRAAET